MLIDAFGEAALSFSDVTFVAIVAWYGVYAGFGSARGVMFICACGGVGEVLDCLEGSLYDFYS